MLRKLNKYENKYLSGTLLPVGLGVLALSVFASLIMKLNFYASDWLRTNQIATNIIQGVTIMLFAISLLAIFSALFIAIFIIMQRYYKNLFTDEGYLTFTLPVKTHQILWSKAICAVLWELFIVICVVAGGTIIAFFGTSASFINPEVVEAFGEGFSFVWQYLCKHTEMTPIIIEYALLMIASIVNQILFVYLAITMGNQIARKHKIIASVGMYFVINMACQTINTVLLIIVGTVMGGFAVIDNMNVEPTSAMFNWIMIGSLVLTIVYSVVFFIVNQKIIKNKLNLE